MSTNREEAARVMLMLGTVFGTLNPGVHSTLVDAARLDPAMREHLKALRDRLTAIVEQSAPTRGAPNQ